LVDDLDGGQAAPPVGGTRKPVGKPRTEDKSGLNIHVQCDLITATDTRCLYRDPAKEQQMNNGKASGVRRQRYDIVCAMTAHIRKGHCQASIPSAFLNTCVIMRPGSSSKHPEKQTAGTSANYAPTERSNDEHAAVSPVPCTSTKKLIQKKLMWPKAASI
jgi:hypothetical protein